MKVTGPGSGAPPEAPQGADDPAATGGPKGPEGKVFADKLERASAAEGSGQSEAVGRAGWVSELGADLRAGRIGADAAISRVIDEVVDRQVGVNAPAAVREKVGAALRQALEDDPLLAAKIRQLAT